MRNAFLVMIFALAHDVGASRVRTRIGKKVTTPPDLSGLWFERRTVMGLGVLQHRFYDIVKGPDGLRAFPITACSSGDSLYDAMGLGSMSCDEEILISIIGVSTDGGERYVATKTTTRTGETVVANLDDSSPTELTWNAGTSWELHTEAVTLLDDWDDEECRALSGAAAGDPLEYDVYGGTSASLEFTNVPGVTIDMFACVHHDWIAKHRARFECVLRKASEGEESDLATKQEMVASALSKLREVMPTDNAISNCVPAVCIGVSVTKFPLPSPIPSISLFVTWPTDQEQCNGANIQKAIAEAQEQGEFEESRVSELGKLGKSAVNGAHGSAISVFPIPNVAYFVMGTFHASRLFSGGIDTDDMMKKAREAAERIEPLIAKAVANCPSLRTRFEGHALAAHVKEALEQSQSKGETLRIVAKSFPELSSMPTQSGARVGFGAGGYGQIGWLGFSFGVFGGGSLKFPALGKKYTGCGEWKEVLDIWYASPLSDLDPERMAALARPLELSE